ncbi:MAG: hypothetical protein ACR2QH_00170 [Geminicoccaceae bacterium]
MKTLFVSTLAAGFLASTAFAEPMQLTEAQLDQVAAGHYDDGDNGGGHEYGYGEYYPYYYNNNYNDNDNDNDNYNYNENNIYISIPIFFGYTGGYPGGEYGGGDSHYGGGQS